AQLTPAVCGGAATPARSAKVGHRSHAAAGSGCTPGAIRPGQEISSGTRRPPSYKLSFRPRSAPALPKNFESDPPLNVGPLSLVTMMTVLLSSPSSRTASTSEPTE